MSHGGAWAGYRAELLRFPDEQFSVACTCNLGASNPTRLAQKVAEIYLEDKMKPGETPPQTASGVTLSHADLQARVGTYNDRQSGAHLFLSLKEGKLFAEGFGLGVELVPLSATRFVSEGPYTIEVTFEGISSARLILRMEDETTEFERISAWTPAASQLAGIAGTYESAEIPGTLTIEIENAALVMRHRTIPKEAFRPTRQDAFHVAGLELRFTRDSLKRVNGFTLSMGRVKGIVYQKIR